MGARLFSSRAFNQDASKAKRAARFGPVVITERGRASHVLLTIEGYLRLGGGRPSIVEQLGMEGPGIEFEPPKAGRLSRRAELS